MPLSEAAAQELSDILQVFGAAYGAAAIPSGQGKALESWVLMKLAYTVDQSFPGWAVSLRRGDESPLPPGAAFTLPQGGSRIQPSDPLAPAHIRLECLADPDLSLELHGSLKWRGRSGALHECDVSAVPVLIASQLRAHGGGYPRGLPVAAIECKDKGGLGTLDETRQTLARLYDLVLVTQPWLGLPLCRIYEERTPSGWGRYSSTYRGFYGRGSFGIVRQSGFQSGTAALADHYFVGRYSNIYTSSSSVSALQLSFVRALANIEAM